MAEPIKLMMDGTLLNWLKQVGDSVKGGEVIAEVEADKATVEVEAPSSGVILELSANVGDELREGAVIATIGASGETPARAGGSQPNAEAAAASQPAPEPGPVEVEAAGVHQGTPAQTEAPAAQTGTGARTPVNGAAASREPAASTTDDGRIKASPVARNMAAERGIDLNQVQGSGPGGRIVKTDIENYSPAAAQAAPVGAPLTEGRPAPLPQPFPGGISGLAPSRKLPEGPDVEIVEVSRMRTRIAATTIESKQQIPHFYVTTDIDITALMALREQINAGLEKDGIKVSVNDLLVKAAALTLQQFPNLNSHFYGDRIVRHKRINVSMAVALEGGGVIYVVAHDADKTTLSAMAKHNKEMIARAREGKVKPEDIQGGTFSTSNLGPYDVDHFAAIINPPESGVLAFGTGKKVPVVLPDGSLGVSQRMKVTISVDHRLSDGAEGAAYLQAYKSLLENPMRLLV